MSTIDRRHVMRAGLLLGGGAAFAASGMSRGLPAETGGLTLYNGQRRTTTAALVAAFTKDTGIEVTVRNAESPEPASQIIEEGANSPADLFYSEQATPIAALAEKSLLAPIDPKTLALV